MIEAIVALSVLTAPPQWQLDQQQLVSEAQPVAQAIFDGYVNHAAGAEVADYYTCYFLYMQDDNVLFTPTLGVFLSPRQIWSIDRTAYPTRYQQDPEFRRVVYAYLHGEVLARFADIGVEGCRSLLERHEMEFHAYLEFTNRE